MFSVLRVMPTNCVFCLQRLYCKHSGWCYSIVCMKIVLYLVITVDRFTVPPTPLIANFNP